MIVIVDEAIINKYYDHKKNNDQLFRDTIKKYIRKEMNVLDAGAGNGNLFDISFLQGKCRSITGVDIDDSINNNCFVDQKIVAPLDNIPLPDDSVDLVYSRYVFEHLKNPVRVIMELNRVLKKNGYAIILTPNKYHYVSLISKITPHRFHEWINAKRDIKESDTFPTYYNCNDAKTLKKAFEINGFNVVEIVLYESVPDYLLWSQLTFYAGLLYERIVNSSNFFRNLRVTLLGVFQKAG